MARKFFLSFTDEERMKILEVMDNPETTKTIRSRCRILLDMDMAHSGGYTKAECAERNGVGPATVTNVVRQCYNEGLDSVLAYKWNQSSSNFSRKLSPEEEQQLMDIADGPPPEGKKSWTVRALAQKSQEMFGVAISKDTVSRMMRKKKQ